MRPQNSRFAFKLNGKDVNDERTAKTRFSIGFIPAFNHSLEWLSILTKWPRDSGSFGSLQIVVDG